MRGFLEAAGVSSGWRELKQAGCLLYAWGCTCFGSIDRHLTIGWCGCGGEVMQNLERLSAGNRLETMTKVSAP